MARLSSTDRRRNPSKRITDQVCGLLKKVLAAGTCQNILRNQLIPFNSSSQIRPKHSPPTVVLTQIKCPRPIAQCDRDAPEDCERQDPASQRRQKQREKRSYKTLIHEIESDGTSYRRSLSRSHGTDELNLVIDRGKPARRP